MSVKWVQEIYDKIKNWEAPNWLKTFIADLQAILVQIAISAGETYLSYLEQKIIEAAQNTALSSEDKFKFVWDAARGSTIPALIELKDNELNTLINSLVSLLKNKGTI